MFGLLVVAIGQLATVEARRMVTED